MPTRWNSTLQTLVASYEAYEDLMKKSQEGKDFYADLESKVAALLERAQSTCQAREAARQQLLDRWVWPRGCCSPDRSSADGGLAPLLPDLVPQGAEEEAAPAAHGPKAAAAPEGGGGGSGARRPARGAAQPAP